MKIFGICVAKNEVDILPHTLTAAKKWCDQVFCLDNGSTDGTWEYMQQAAAVDERIVAWKQDDRPFNNAIRSDVFNAFRARAQNGDWWCRLDADEIYVDSPRETLEKAKGCEVVWGLHLQYYFTEKDLASYEQNPDLYRAELPPRERYHWYLANSSEPRFFKYRKRLQWPDGAWPRHMGRVCSKRLLLNHYQYRTPMQIQQRLQDRLAARGLGCDSFRHVSTTEWKDIIKNSSTLNYDDGIGPLVINERQAPSHRDTIARAVVKNLMHTSGIWP